MEMDFASKGVAGTALGLGAGALGLELARGGLTGLFGGGTGDNAPVSRREADLAAQVARLEGDVKLRDANTYTDGKLLELYKTFDMRIGCVERELCDQKVYNATNTGAISCIQQQIATLMSLTKVIIPNGNICPGWGDVTVSTTTTTTA